MAAASFLGGFSVIAPGSSIGQSAMAILRDPGSILADRSPGARTAGALTQSKATKLIKSPARRATSQPSADGPPLQRAQAALAPAVERPGLASGLPILPARLDVLPETPATGGDLFAPGSGVPESGIGPGFGFPSGGGGGGGGGGYNVPLAPPVVPDVGEPGGVPEPATWFTLILGFAGIGYVSRRRARLTTRVNRAPRG